MEQTAIPHKEEQQILLHWFGRHGVIPSERLFREAFQVVLDAKELDEPIPWVDMEKEFIPPKIRIVKPNTGKASDLVKYLKQKKAVEKRI